LIVATPISDARTIRSWAMNLTPAVTAPFPWSAGGSAGRIRPRKNAEPRNDSASAMTANGAERDQVQLRHRQHVQRVADRDGGEQRGPA